MRIKGLYTAVITPFLNNGTVDLEGLRQNIRYQLKCKVDGIVVMGTTGEEPTITDPEKDAILKLANEEIKGKAVFMVGTGKYSTEATIQATRKAKAAGADAALIVTPYYNKPTQEGIYRHFAAVAQNVDLPIVVYNHPGRAGLGIQTETLARIATIPRIVGVKDCSGNVSQMMDLIDKVRKINPSFSVMSGDDALTLALMVHGGDGLISVISNLIPAQMKLLIVAIQQGNFDEARRLHFELLPLFHAENIETNPIPVKAMMNLVGMPAGGYRLPLCELLPENARKLQEILESLNTIHYDKTQSTPCQVACGLPVS